MHRALCWFSLPLAVACVPDLDLKASRVSETRVVAVRANPAEVAPGQSVSWQAIVVTPLAVSTQPQIDWAMCTAPRNPSDPITVADACFAVAVDADPTMMGAPIVTTVAGAGGAFESALIPMDICRKIGPDVSGTSATGAKQRPPDPDITGGYQVPIRLVTSDATGVDVAFDRQRVHCSLANAPAAVARDFTNRYKNNTNPDVASIALQDQAVPPDGTGRFQVPRGATLPISIQWDPALAIESYVAYDTDKRELVDRTEQLDVSWYTNGGQFHRDRTLPDPGNASASNTIELDANVTELVTIWVVLRDERGGVGLGILTLEPL